MSGEKSKKMEVSISQIDFFSTLAMYKQLTENLKRTMVEAQGRQQDKCRHGKVLGWWQMRNEQSGTTAIPSAWLRVPAHFFWGHMVVSHPASPTVVPGSWFHLLCPRGVPGCLGDTPYSLLDLEEVELGPVTYISNTPGSDKGVKKYYINIVGRSH
jgi:hypothetical protein